MTKSYRECRYRDICPDSEGDECNERAMRYTDECVYDIYVPQCPCIIDVARYERDEARNLAEEILRIAKTFRESLAEDMGNLSYELEELPLLSWEVEK